MGFFKRGHGGSREAAGPVGSGGAGAAPPPANEHVNAIISEYRERMQLAARYRAEVAATGGLVWQSAEFTAIRRRQAEIEAAAAASRGSSGLMAMGPAAIPSILQAVAAQSNELRDWDAMSKSGLDGVFTNLLMELGGERGSEAVEQYKQIFE